MSQQALEVFIYQHVPKCGGRSFIQAVRKHLTKISDSPPSFSTIEQRQEFLKSKLDLARLPAGTLVHGHLVHEGLWPSQRYANELRTGRYGLITIIRDPLERALSAYFHRRKRGKAFEGTVQQFLETRRNCFCDFLGIKMNWRKRPKSDPFLMIGLTERLQDSLDLFASIAGFPSEPIERVNASPRDQVELTKKELARFKKNNAADYALYAYAIERFEKQIGELRR